MKVYKREQSDRERAASKRGRRNRDKGGRFEKVIEKDCNQVIEDFDCGGYASKGFKSEKDVIWLSHNGRTIFNIECKHWKKVNWREAYEDALRRQRAGSMPVAVCKDNQKEPVMIMPWRLGRQALAALAKFEEENAGGE